ncbi:MAG: response regulator transcription factor [Chloroflexota bacterium]
MARILIVEDDEKLRDIIANHLRRYGHEPQAVADFAQVRDEFLRLSPDLVLLDVNLPYYDGFYWCRQIRAVSQVPIIFLSARTGDMDQVFAMENGGDDYVTKPFSLEVLTAKIGSVLRRVRGELAPGAQPAQAGTVPPGSAPAATHPQLSVGGLTLDDQRCQAIYGDQRVELSLTEFRLLSLLMRSAGSIVTRETLLEQLWDDVSFVDDNTLNVNVARVRRRLEQIGFAGGIVTRRGQGYMLETAGPATGRGEQR